MLNLIYYLLFIILYEKYKSDPIKELSVYKNTLQLNISQAQDRQIHKWLRLEIPNLNKNICREVIVEL